MPRKALRKINGKSLVGYAVESAKESAIFNLLVVASDSKDIIVDGLGASMCHVVELPKNLTQDNSPKWGSFRYIVKTLEQYIEENIDVLVDLDVGTPLRQPEDIEGCVEKLSIKDHDVICTAYEADRNPYFNMVEVNGGKVQVVKQLSEPTANRQQAPKVYSLCPAVYAIKREALFKYDHWSQANLGLHIIPRERAWDIDTELDLKIVKFLMEGKLWIRKTYLI